MHVSTYLYQILLNIIFSTYSFLIFQFVYVFSHFHYSHNLNKCYLPATPITVERTIFRKDRGSHF